VLSGNVGIAIAQRIPGSKPKHENLLGNWFKASRMRQRR
jgi:hypothetical protein